MRPLVRKQALNRVLLSARIACVGSNEADVIGKFVSPQLLLVTGSQQYVPLILRRAYSIEMYTVVIP